MRPFQDEVDEIMVHYHDVARAHSMDHALREAVEAEVFTRRECAGLRRRVEELQRQLAGEVVEALDFLWREYVRADPATLTEDAKELATKVREKVRELAGVARLETALAEAERMRPFIECLYAQRVHEDGWCEECETFNGHAPDCVMGRVEAVLGVKAPEVQCMGCCGECEIRRAQEKAVQAARRAVDAANREAEAKSARAD